MPEVFTPGTSTPPDLAYTLPIDGDTVSFETLCTDMIKPLATGLSYVANNVGAGAQAATNAWTGPNTFSDITVGTGAHYKVTSRAETRICSVTWANVVGSSFQVNADGSVTDTGTGSGCVAHVFLPNGATLNEVHVSINPANGHAGLPATKPAFILTSQDITTSTFTTIATGVDGSSTAGGYDAIHYISATGLSVAIDRATKAYTVQLTGELGGNALANLVVYGAVKLVYTRTTVGED